MFIGDIEDRDVVEVDDPVVRQRVPLRNPFARLWEAFMPVVHAAQWGAWKRTVYGHVYQYGLAGGSLTDGLTAQQGWLTWRYNYSQATMYPYETYEWTCTAGRDYYGNPNCRAPYLQIPPMFPYNLGWWAYNFYIGNQFAGPGTVIHRTDYSSYFFNNYNTLNHTFQNQRIAYANGHGTCLFAYSGSIVFGPTNWCTLTNPVPD